MMVTRCYKYRLYPTTDQQSRLIQWAGCRRYVWNWALRCKQTHYRTTGKTLRYTALAAALTDLKHQPDTTFLRECHSQPLQQTLLDLETAFTNFFEKRAKYPRFKSRKKTLPSLRFPQHVTAIDNETVSVPKIGLIRAVIHRPLLGTIKSATIKQDTTRAWFVTFVCHISLPFSTPTCENPVGIDMGLETFTTLHTGIKVTPPRFYRRNERKIKRLQRHLSRSQKGSSNRQKAHKRVARFHQRIHNQRRDWLHKHAVAIIRQFDTVCIETLNIKGLARTKLAKSFSDASISTFMQMLSYKAEWHGRSVIKVDRFFASSKCCHQCHEKAALTLSDRTWTCNNCGMVHDRDINAAINILHEGLRVLAAGQSRG